MAWPKVLIRMKWSLACYSNMDKREKASKSASYYIIIMSTRCLCRIHDHEHTIACLLSRLNTREVFFNLQSEVMKPLKQNSRNDEFFIFWMVVSNRIVLFLLRFQACVKVCLRKVVVLWEWDACLERWGSGWITTEPSKQLRSNSRRTLALNKYVCQYNIIMLKKPWSNTNEITRVHQRLDDRVLRVIELAWPEKDLQFSGIRPNADLSIMLVCKWHYDKVCEHCVITGWFFISAGYSKP